MDEYIGRSTTITCDSTQQEDGVWKTVFSFKEDRSKDLLDWERKEFSVQIFGDVLEDTVAQANGRFLLVLDSYNGSLFSEKEKTDGIQTNSNEDTES